MPLTSGTKLGPYEIVAPIGAGGMGEVYRARDTRLGRNVALKVLPEAFASDRERMARLRREAQVLASLNHPNIAAIYGFEDTDGTHALAMELAEGPTLAERVKQGPTPLDEALPIAEQICEALEYAHERGIIHRDLKPSNVKVTPDGAVKVLDFGLAKAIEGDASATSVENSPTLSAMATRAGFLLGTAAYMSPEQARGKNADRRSDIWAFGVVLFEMLSGKRMFAGETTSDTLAEVLKMEPEWGALPANIPPRIRDLLQRCLRKDPRQRLQAIGDARIAIDEALSGAPEAGTFAAQPDTYEKIGERLAWGTAVLLGLLAALLGIGYVARAPVPTAATVAEIPSPKDENFALAGLSAAPPVVSPDGKRLAFGAIGKDGKQLLWVRALNGTTAQPLAGTDGATFPFWSPDSRQLGYFADGKLNRIDVAGGPPFSICDTSGVGRGGSWGSDGTILFAPTFNSGLFRVPSSGGTPQPVTKVGSIAHEASHRWPQLLPDGKHFLFFSFGASSENSGTYLSSLDGGEPRLILRVSSSAVFVPPGYLLFVLDGALMAQQFDAESLRLTGASVPLTSQTLANPILRNGIFSASDNGVLVYETGESATANQILWLDRTGKALGTTGPPGEYAGPQISPDGHRLAISLTTLGVPNFDIWVYDILRGRSTRLTFNLAADVAPAWSPDGKTVAFTSSRKGAFSIYEKAADGSGETEPLFVDDASEDNSSWSSDGRYLLFDRVPTNSSASAIWALPLFGDRKPRIVVESGFGVNEPALSPNGKWLAYRSVDESGLPEIYVMPFPSGGGKWQVSTNGGNYPRWRRDSKELYFLSLDSKIVAASIAEQGTSIAIGNVKPLFSVNIAPGISPGNPFDVSADGLKFVVVSQAGLQAPPPLTLVTNWPALLKKQ